MTSGSVPPSSAFEASVEDVASVLQHLPEIAAMMLFVAAELSGPSRLSQSNRDYSLAPDYPKTKPQISHPPKRYEDEDDPTT